MGGLTFFKSEREHDPHARGAAWREKKVSAPTILHTSGLQNGMKTSLSAAILEVKLCVSRSMSLLGKKKRPFVGVPAPLGYVPGLGRG